MQRNQGISREIDAASPVPGGGKINLAAWGVHDLAYFKPLNTDEIDACAIFAGDGHLIAIVGTEAQAREYIDSIDVAAAALH